MNDLDLPPRRTLSPEVRDRIRRTMDIEVPRQNRFRAPLAVAAGVAVLAAGAVMVAQSTGDDSNPVGTPPSTTSPAPVTDPPGSTTSAPADTSVPPAETQAMLNLCHAALVDNEVANVAPRHQWKPQRSTPRWPDGSATVAAFAGEKPVFCHVSPTTVTVNDPNATPVYAPGTRTGVLLAIPGGSTVGGHGGALGGVVDPSWSQLGLLIHHAGGGVMDSLAGFQEDGIFLLPTQYPAGATFEAYQVIGDNSVLPANPPDLPIEEVPVPIVVPR